MALANIRNGMERMKLAREIKELITRIDSHIEGKLSRPRLDKFGPFETLKSKTKGEETPRAAKVTAGEIHITRKEEINVRFKNTEEFAEDEAYQTKKKKQSRPWFFQKNYRKQASHV